MVLLSRRRSVKLALLVLLGLLSALAWLGYHHQLDKQQKTRLLACPLWHHLCSKLMGLQVW